MVSWTCAATFQPTRSMSWNGVIGSPIGAKAFSTVSSGVPSYTARAASPITLASRRLTTKPGASAVSTAFLPRPRATTNAVESAASVVCGVRTISMSGMTATGLKKWNPTRRSGCASFAPISSTDSEEVLVARIASSATICLDLAEHLLLDADLLEDGLDDEVAVRVFGLVGRSVTSARSRFAASPSRRPLSLELADLVADVGETLLDARLIEVGDQHRHFELAQEQQRELAGHQTRADDARPS